MREGDFDDQVYDIAGNSWTAGSPSPFTIEGEAAAVVGAQIYVAGGRSGGSYLSTLIIYDPATDTWTSAPNSPVAHYFAGAAVVNNLLYVVGANASGASGAEVDVYDPTALKFVYTKD